MTESQGCLFTLIMVPILLFAMWCLQFYLKRKYKDTWPEDDDKPFIY